MQCSGRGQALVRVLLDEGAGEGAENSMLDFPSVFACSRVLNFAIDAHDVFCLQYVSVSVTAEVAGSSPVVPARF